MDLKELLKTINIADPDWDRVPEGIFSTDLGGLTSQEVGKLSALKTLWELRKLEEKEKYKNYNVYKSYSGGEGYKSFAFYRQSEVTYDFTIEFCALYINKFSRTHDQMTQAGRSGKQNIAEGYLQKGLMSRIKLVGVARGSLEELLKDYEDFLRQRGLPLWDKDDPRARKVRRLVYKLKDHKDYKLYNDYKIYLRSPEEAANAMICLVNQTNALLDKKLRWLEKQFVEEGGYRERLSYQRREHRKDKISGR